MNKQFQAFTEEFLNHMRVEDAWPPESRMEEWVRVTLGGSIKTHDYAGLQGGDAIPAHSAQFVVKALLGADGMRDVHNGDLERARNILFAYLKDRGVHEPERLRSDEAMRLLCGPVLARRQSKHRVRDRFMEGLAAFFDILGAKRLVNRHVQACPQIGGAESTALWGMVTVGRMLAPSDPPLPQHEAMSLLERHFGNGFTRAGGEDVIRKMQQVHPWVVVFARGKSAPTGVSIMLPLTASAYARALRGELSCLEFSADDFTIPSRYLFVKMVAERPVDLGGDPLEDATASLLRCCLAQAAVLSRASDPPYDQPLKLITFAAAPTSRRRAEVQHYKPTGVNMKGTNLELLSRTLKLRGAKGQDVGAAATLVFLSTMLSGPPEP